MDKLYDENFKSTIRTKILNNEFKNKDDLINYIKKYSEEISNNIDLFNLISQNGVQVNTEDLDDIIAESLTYYDENSVNANSLNLDNVSKINIDNKDYIKINNADDTYTILDNNISDKDFVTQFKEKQNDSVNFQGFDGIKNTEEIVDNMKLEKEEASLESSLDAERRNLTLDEQKELATILNLPNMNTSNFVVDTKRNIYINSDTGDTYYVNRNTDGKLEIKKVNEQKVDTINTNVNVVNESEINENLNVETPTDLEEYDVTDDEIVDTYNNYYNILTDEQKEEINKIIKLRNLQVKVEEKAKENEKINEINMKPKEKVLTLQNMNKTYNGFTSVVFICLMTSIYGIGMLLYIFVSNGIIR